MRLALFTTSVTLLMFAATSAVNGHMTFKKEISKKYPEMKITCNACHIKNKPKTERNEFGELFAKELKEKKISADFKSKRGDERKKFEKEVMVPEFTKALKKIKKLKPKDSELTYNDLIKSGEMPEITKKPETAEPDAGAGDQ